MKTLTQEKKPYNHTGHPCSLCNKKFTRKSDAKRHERIIHTGEKPYNCAYCDKKFTRKNDAKKHEERFHTKEKPKNIKEDLVDKEIDDEDVTEVFETNTTNDAKKEIIKDDDIKEYENTDEITSLTDTSVTEEEISLNEQNDLLIHLTEDNELCIKASKYLNEEMCLICDMQFHTSVEALNHIKKEHIDIIEPKKVMIEDEITSPLMSKKEIDKQMENPFSCALCKKAFSQPNDLQNHVESNHLNTSLEDTPMSKHIQSQHPTVKSKINKKNTLFTKEMTKQKISFTENNPSDLVDKKIDNEDSKDVFETNTTNEAKYQVDLTDDNPVTEEDTSEISLPMMPMKKNKGKNKDVKGLRQNRKNKCKICKYVFDSSKGFFQHLQNGCSLWKFIPPKCTNKIKSVGAI